MDAAHSVVKRQSRKTADEKRACVDQVGGEIENLRLFQDVLGHDELDEFKMSTRADVDEYDAQWNEGYEHCLASLSASFLSP